MNIKHLNILIFGLQFPEPQSTAAGSRMLQLISLFQDYGYKVHFACAQPRTNFSTDLKEFDVIEHTIRLNDDTAKILLEKVRPGIIMFDRFITEEQFGWTADEICPEALKILDTEDLHFLRENREKLIKKPSKKLSEFNLTDKAKREIGAIYRCDLTLMISKAEIDILKQNFDIPESLLFYLPFVYNTLSIVPSELPAFTERKNIMTIGNFKHAPNLDMVLFLYKEIWPQIRKTLKNVEWHIYGAYTPRQIEQLNQPQKGVFVKGRAENAKSTITKYRMMLAPLRFGAGLKGKCLDAMQAATPSITTNIGAEGIAKAKDWPGFVEDDSHLFAEKTIELYQNRSLWQEKQQQTYNILRQNFNIQKFSQKFKFVIINSLKDLNQIRQKNIIGELLKHHHHRSTKFMSLWIEEKNK